MGLKFLSPACTASLAGRRTRSTLIGGHAASGQSAADTAAAAAGPLRLPTSLTVEVSAAAPVWWSGKPRRLAASLLGSGRLWLAWSCVGFVSGRRQVLGGVRIAARTGFTDR